MIEQADRFFFFIRPRRFGKSLTLSVLQHYYDIRTRDRFDALFGDLYIGQHPTPSRNTYLVPYLNFSGISGQLSDYSKGLDAHCRTTFEKFCHIYADLLPPDTLEGLRVANGAVEQLVAQANRYAESETVKRSVGGTQLHKVVVVYKGMEMRVCEEV